jgi:antitoxin HicB
MSDQIKHYVSLRYPIELTPDPDGGYVAEHPDLPGCIAQGETADEAVAALGGARRLWVEARLEENLPVPEPTEDNEYSGKFLLRLPRSVHAQLVRIATKEGVSLNHYVSTVLARHLGSAPLHTILQNIQVRLDETLEELKAAGTESVASSGRDLWWGTIWANFGSVSSRVRPRAVSAPVRGQGLTTELDTKEWTSAQSLVIANYHKNT